MLGCVNQESQKHAGGSAGESISGETFSGWKSLGGFQLTSSDVGECEINKTGEIKEERGPSIKSRVFLSDGARRFR